MKIKSSLIYAPGEIEVVISKYVNGGMALLAVDPVSGEPIAKLSVNVPELPLMPGQVLIKDYAENEGALKSLLDAGLVEVLGECPVGYSVASLCLWKGSDASLGAS